MKSQLLKHSLRVTLAVMALSTATTGFARKLSPDEAIQRANEFQQATADSQLRVPYRISTRGNVTQTDKLSLAYTAEKVGAENTPAFYVFNNSATKDGGFIIATGDDRLRPVLAVVDNGTFDPRNLPDNLKWWLSQYEEEINAYLSSAASIAAPAITASTAGNYYDNYASWSTIYPLVTTTWDQGDPYNGMCPEYGGGRSMTGCVATAMAQVINYHKYVKGKGTHSYKPANWDTSATVSYDFGNAKFDWNNMLDTYTESATATQKNAVANLMFACGVAVDMQYSAASSGAFSPVNGLINYLGYHEKTAEIPRSTYQSAEWEAMIYKELTQNRPLIYSGSTPKGGHAFVCDGYSQNGYFHINWGWGGYCDGYFTLSALNPDGKGIGGFDGGYNGGQSFVRMITPNDPYLDEYEESRYGVKFNNDFTHSSTGGTNEYFSNSIYLWWAPSYPATLRYAVCVVAADGSTVYLASSSSVKLERFSYYNPQRYSVNFGSANLAAGDYKVYPAFYAPSTNTYGRMFSDGGKLPFINMTVSAAGKRTFKAADKYNLEFSDIDISSQIYQEGIAYLTYTVTNPIDYDFIDQINYTLAGSGSTSYILDGTNMIIRSGESVTIQTTFQGTTKDGAAVPAGTYRLVFKGDKSGETFSSPTVNIKVLSGRDPSLPDAPQIITSVDQVPQEWLNGESLSIPLDYLASTEATIYLHYNLYYRNTDTRAYFWPNAYKLNIPRGIGSLGSAIFTPTQDLPAGEYDFVFDNYLDNGREISQRVPVTVGLTQGEITYRLAVDGTFSRAVRLESATATEISIPASISTASKSYPVKEISTEMMAYKTKVTRVNIPASVTEIGNDAFKGASSLKYVFFDGATVPLKYAQTAFSGCDRNMEVYVPGEAWSGYSSAFGQIAKVYAKITGVKVDTDITVKKGETATVDITPTPAQNTNPNYTVTTSAGNIATAKVENGLLVIEGIDNGSATLTLSSAQPGVKSTTINVTVSDQQSDDNNYDINGDGVTNIGDVVSLVDYVLARSTDASYDFNSDTNVNVGDVIYMVNRIVGAAPQNLPARSDGEISLLPFDFTCPEKYIAMQADLKVEGNGTIRSIELNKTLANSHIMAWGYPEEGIVRVMIFSLANSVVGLEAGEPVFTLGIEGSLNVECMELIYVNQSRMTCYVAPTAIGSVGADSEIVAEEYFDFSGRKLSGPYGVCIKRSLHADGSVTVSKINR